MGQIEEALATVRAMLAPEGYGLTAAEPVGSTLPLTVTAGPDACEYCLAPKSVLDAIVVKNLQEHGLSMAVTLAYPGDAPTPEV